MLFYTQSTIAVISGRCVSRTRSNDCIATHHESTATILFLCINESTSGCCIPQEATKVQRQYFTGRNRCTTVTLHGKQRVYCSCASQKAGRVQRQHFTGSNEYIATSQWKQRLHSANTSHEATTALRQHFTRSNDCIATTPHRK